MLEAPKPDTPRASGDGDWAQVWVSKRLPGKSFANKVELKQALVDLDAQEAANKSAGPVLDALKGITEQLDAKDGLRKLDVVEVIKLDLNGDIPSPLADQVRQAAGLGAVDWSKAHAYVKADGDVTMLKGLAMIEVKGDKVTTPVPVIAALKAFFPTIAKKDFTQEERDKAAKSGAAMKDGSYPINDKGDIENAIKLYGRAKNKAAAKRHIVKRAKALGATDLLPDDWAGSSKGKDKSTTKVAGDGDLAKTVSPMEPVSTPATARAGRVDRGRL